MNIIKGNPENCVVAYWIKGVRCPMMLEVENHMGLVASVKNMLRNNELTYEDIKKEGRRAILISKLYGEWYDKNQKNGIIENDNSMPLTQDHLWQWVGATIILMYDKQINDRTYENIVNDKHNGFEYIPKSVVYANGGVDTKHEL